MTVVVPGFHYGVLGLNLLWSPYGRARSPGVEWVLALLTAVALLALCFYVRRFALTVQSLDITKRIRVWRPYHLRA